jgi:hypothetical protein
MSKIECTNVHTSAWSNTICANKFIFFLVKFTNIGAIGIVTNALFFMFLCQKVY